MSLRLALFASILSLASGAAFAQAHDGQRDFDFNMGTWKTHVSRLVHPLSGSNAWAQYDGTSVVRPLWQGRASVFELDVEGPAGHIEGVGLRLYDPKTRQWSLNWANGSNPMMTTPMLGSFRNGVGEFADHEMFDGKPVQVRNRFLDITADSSRFEQAFSADGGKTWEINWVMTFARTN